MRESSTLVYVPMISESGTHDTFCLRMTRFDNRGSLLATYGEIDEEERIQRKHKEAGPVLEPAQPPW